MKATVKKWGNSAAVRIPASVMEAMHLDLDEVVEVREEKGRIVIEPVGQKTYVVDDLLTGITAKNLHEPIDFGPAEGKEYGKCRGAMCRTLGTSSGLTSHPKPDMRRQDAVRPWC